MTFKKRMSRLMFFQSFLQRAKHTTFGGVDEVFEKVTPSHDLALWPAFSSSCKSLLLNSRVPVSTDPPTLVIDILMNAILLGAPTQHHLPLFFFSFCCCCVPCVSFVSLFMEVVRSFCGRQIAYVTFFKSSATWAPTFCFGGWLSVCIIFYVSRQWYGC